MEQQILPFKGMRLYPLVGVFRASGDRRYRRHLVRLACTEIGEEGGGYREKTQAKVCQRAEEIHDRHYPDLGGFEVADRTLRHDKVCERLWRRLRGLENDAAGRDLRHVDDGSFVRRCEFEALKRRCELAERQREETKLELAQSRAMEELAAIHGPGFQLHDAKTRRGP